MGMYDYITCEAPVPNHGDISKCDGQTKRFFRNFAQLTITKDGQLIETLFRMHSHDATSATHLEDANNFAMREPIGQRQLPFHGDLPFCVCFDERRLTTFVARFTNGALEAIRLFDELAEVDQMLVYMPME